MGYPQTVGSLEQAASFLRTGQVLGKYELLHPVAMGGMAKVWAAREEGSANCALVAIKTVLPQFASHAEFRKMFEDEARVASLLSHENVCGVHGFWEDRGVQYLVMDWISGDSLARLLRPAGRTTMALEARMAARIVADAARGLHAAHELRGKSGEFLSVVHRDVSPHNILLSGDGTVKVTDFGVAKAVGQVHAMTRAGELKGKVMYMSPEQVAGRPLDRRADVFGLGCVLYECVVGQSPFGGMSEAEAMRAISSGSYPPPEEAGVPAELCEIVHRALASERENRFGTALEMADALTAYAEAHGGVVRRTEVQRLLRARLGERIAKRQADLRKALERASDDAPRSPRGSAMARPVAQPRTLRMIALEPPRRPAGDSDRASWEPGRPSWVSVPPEETYASGVREKQEPAPLTYADPEAITKPDLRRRQRSWFFTGSVGFAVFLGAVGWVAEAWFLFVR